MENALENLNSRRFRRRTKVETSKYREEIERRLQFESPHRVSKWLEEKGERISERSLRNYRNDFIGPKALLSKALRRGSLYAHYRDIMKEKADALQELYNLVFVQIERLNMGLKIEQDKGALTGMVTSSLDLLRRLLRDILTVEMDLGLRQRASSKSNGGMSDSDLKDLLERVINANENFTWSASKTDANDDDPHEASQVG